MVAICVLCERTALCRKTIEEAKAAGRAYGMTWWSRLKTEADDQLAVRQHFLQAPAPDKDENRQTEPETSLPPRRANIRFDSTYVSDGLLPSRYNFCFSGGDVPLTATVEIRLIGDNLALVMRDMRTWLDHRKVAPRAFRQSACPGGLALHVEFSTHTAAEDFAARFTGRVLGAPPPVHRMNPISTSPRGR